MSNNLKIVIGPNVNEPGGFKVFLGDEDITEKLHVKSMTLKVSSDPDITTVNLECYAENIEILASAVNVTVIKDENAE